MSSAIKASPPVLISVCIISYKRPSSLKICLDSVVASLQHLEPKSYEVIVSDDCPNKSALEVVRSFRFIRWIQGPCRGVAANRNNVVKAATGTWILFIDDDEIADEYWSLYYKQAILSEKWDVIEGRVQPTNYPDSILWYAPTISKGGAFCTANLAIKRVSFHSIGGFNESFNVSHEDVDFGIRIRQAGFRSIYLDQALVFHPARRYTFKQVWNRIVDLQCQSYLTNIPPPHNASLLQLYVLITFCFKYWFRITRFELLARQRHQWRRQAQVSVLLLITTPVSLMRLLKLHFT